jgi:serine/threonine protein kinase
MATDAAQGMLFLHNHRPQVVHRDLKSPNLLVDQDLHIKIAYFHLSKIIEEVESVQTSAGAGSNPRWVPPEVLEGEKFTAAGDVFAFGVVMWELLMWDIPWVRTKLFQIPGIFMGGGRLEVPGNKGDLPGYCAKEFRGLDGYIALMKRCWAQKAEDRLGFGKVIAELRTA